MISLKQGVSFIFLVAETKCLTKKSTYFDSWLEGITEGKSWRQGYGAGQGCEAVATQPKRKDSGGGKRTGKGSAPLSLLTSLGL